MSKQGGGKATAPTSVIRRFVVGAMALVLLVMGTQAMMTVVDPDAALRQVPAAGAGWIARGRSALERALESGAAKDQRLAHLDAAEDALRRGLALSPADPYAWAYAAYVAWLRGAPAEHVESRLQRSLALGPAERNLADLRGRMAAALGRYGGEAEPGRPEVR